MIGREAVVVPADGATDLGVIAVDAAAGVVRGGNAAGGPVGEPAKVTEAGGDGARAGAGLAFELHQV